MYVCFVKHPGSEKRYLFDCTDIHRRISVGRQVVCETIRGLQPGIVESYPVEIKENFVGGEKAIIEAIGAYLPLKKIVRLLGDVELLDEERRLIALRWLEEQQSR